MSEKIAKVGHGLFAGELFPGEIRAAGLLPFAAHALQRLANRRERF